MTKLLEKFSQTKAGKRVIKVAIAITLLPAIISWAIIQDLFTERANRFSVCE